jgi:hypothetical protein
MTGKISIQNSKYFRPFDNTDNPCCWQVDQISEDVDQILESSRIDFDMVPGDWGTSYSWKSQDSIEHSMNITCVDVETVRFEIEFWATKKGKLGLRKTVLESTSDFDFLLPKIRKLDQNAQQ